MAITREEQEEVTINYNIALKRTFDELGRTINQYVNLNGGYNASLWGGVQTKIPKSKFSAKLDVNGTFSHTPNIINEVKGITNAYSITFTPGLSFSDEKLMDAEINLGTIYTNSTNTIQTSRNIKFLSFNPSASFNVYLPKNFELGTDVDYQYNPPVGPYTTSFNRFIWDASLSYKTLTNKNLELKASVNDMLNQNRGYERTTENNFNSERNFLTLGRYFQLGAIWTFNTGPMAATKQKPSSGGKVRMMRGGGRRRH